MQVQTPYGYVIFCDDVRFERSGKETFVGVYKDRLFVPELPVALPRLFAVTHYIETADQNHEPVILEIALPDSEPDKPLIAQELPIGALRDRAARGVIPKDSRLTVRGHFEFPLLSLTKEGDIIVTIKSGSDELEIGRLKIELRAPDLPQ